MVQVSSKPIPAEHPTLVKEKSAAGRLAETSSMGGGEVFMGLKIYGRFARHVTIAMPSMTVFSVRRNSKGIIAFVGSF